MAIAHNGGMEISAFARSASACPTPQCPTPAPRLHMTRVGGELVPMAVPRPGRVVGDPSASYHHNHNSCCYNNRGVGFTFSIKRRGLF